MIGTVVALAFLFAFAAGAVCGWRYRAVHDEAHAPTFADHDLAHRRGQVLDQPPDAVRDRWPSLHGRDDDPPEFPTSYDPRRPRR